jgi:hypothetical protein
MPSKKKKTNKGVNPVTVGVAGAAVVAAGVAAVALSKKGNRKKAGKMLNQVKAGGKALGVKAVAGLDKAQQLREKIGTPSKSVAKKGKKRGSKSSSAKRQTKSTGPAQSRVANSKMVN